MKSKWEQFSKEELQTFANETSNQEEFCIKIGYTGRNDNAIKAIKEKYPDFTFPKRMAHNFENLTGKKFGRLTVIEQDTSKTNKIYWICRCDCGVIKSIAAHDLKTRTRSCGCLRNQKVRETIGNNLTGQRFGLLVVEEQVDSIKEPSGMLRTAWKCKCDCGKEIIVKTRDLIAKETRSCGCLRSSYGEKQIEQILQLNNIVYLKEYSFSNLTSDKGRVLRFDFAVFNKNKLCYLIECQGIQHFQSVAYFGGEEKFQIRQKNDALKRKFCKDNGIPLVEIPYVYNKDITPNEVIKENLLC